MTIENSLKRQGIDILKKDQNALDGAFKRQAKEKAPDKYQLDEISQQPDGSWARKKVDQKERIYDEDVVPQKEKEFKEEAEVLQELCRRVDNKIISLNNLINFKKEQIVNLSTTANNGNCYQVLHIVEHKHHQHDLEHKQ